MAFGSVHGRRVQLRLPLSPVRAEMALKALEDWRQPADAQRVRSWFAIANEAAGPTQVNIFDEISWWGVSAQEFCDQIAAIDGDLEVHINSPGGDAFDGITVFNALAGRKGAVTTVVDGLAASAASVIAMAGSERVMAPGSMMMIHDALAMCIGNAADMRETAQLLDKVSDSIASVYAARAGKTGPEWRSAMAGDAWYSAQEAVDAGLAHRLSGDQATASAWSDRSVFANWHGLAEDPHAGISNAAADESSWDGPAAMSWASSQDDPEAAFRAICAGEKTTGEPDTQDHWALPHHKHAGDPPNRKGVSSALGYLGATKDLKSEAAARSHLEAHQKAMGGDGDADDKADWLTALMEGTLL